ncbi:MAG: hypothetical protein FWF76_01275 [Oscillospiraceae bacterium]|nr:hypothetical protein [Oscillospiraceae bacterium]
MAKPHKITVQPDTGEIIIEYYPTESLENNPDDYLGYGEASYINGLISEITEEPREEYDE